MIRLVLKLIQKTKTDFWTMFHFWHLDQSEQSMICARLWLVQTTKVLQTLVLVFKKLQNNIAIKPFNLPGNDWILGWDKFSPGLVCTILWHLVLWPGSLPSFISPPRISMYSVWQVDSGKDWRFCPNSCPIRPSFTSVASNLIYNNLLSNFIYLHTIGSQFNHIIHTFHHF